MEIDSMTSSCIHTEKQQQQQQQQRTVIIIDENAENKPSQDNLPCTNAGAKRKALLDSLAVATGTSSSTGKTPAGKKIKICEWIDTDKGRVTFIEKKLGLENHPQTIKGKRTVRKQ